MSLNIQKRPCHVEFTLSSLGFHPIRAIHNVDHYRMPCEDAAKFLRGVGDVLNPRNGHPVHKVTYFSITDGTNTNSDHKVELPNKTAAKVALFMDQPNRLPGTSEP